MKPESNLDLICVEKAKVDLTDEVDGIDVDLVTTFIFYKEGKEPERIIESPVDSLKKILKIF